MTAEERLAYFQGEKRRAPTCYSTKSKEYNYNKIIFKIKVMISVLLFIAFLSVDYMGYEIHEIGSERIIQEVCTDYDFSVVVDKLLHR